MDEHEVSVNHVTIKRLNFRWRGPALPRPNDSSQRGMARSSQIEAEGGGPCRVASQQGFSLSQRVTGLSEQRNVMFIFLVRKLTH